MPMERKTEEVGATYMITEEMVITEIQPINVDWTNLQKQ
jgi:hypothetical protein